MGTLNGIVSSMGEGFGAFVHFGGRFHPYSLRHRINPSCYDGGVWYYPSFTTVPNTNGFKTLAQHYADHGGEFGTTTEAEYFRLADELWASPKPLHIKECKRKKGDIVRFDTLSESFGVVDKNNVIRTFFKPIPCHTIPSTQRAVMQQEGRCHGSVDNLTYYREECRRW